MTCKWAVWDTPTCGLRAIPSHHFLVCHRRAHWSPGNTYILEDGLPLEFGLVQIFIELYHTKFLKQVGLQQLQSTLLFFSVFRLWLGVSNTSSLEWLKECHSLFFSPTLYLYFTLHVLVTELPAMYLYRHLDYMQLCVPSGARPTHLCGQVRHNQPATVVLVFTL